MLISPNCWRSIETNRSRTLYDWEYIYYNKVTIHATFLLNVTGNFIGSEQGFFYRPPGPNRRPPVPVYRTGWTVYRLKPVELKFEFKTHSYTGFEHLTGRLDRFTGPV